MNKIILVFALAILGLSGCTKEEAPKAVPEPAFAVNGLFNDSHTIATYDECRLTNYTPDAALYTWDLGNGTTSNEEEVVLRYPRSGSYTVTLTVTYKDGEKSSTSKTIRVADRVVKRARVTALNWNSISRSYYDWPTFTKANIWIEIVKAEHNQTYPVLNNLILDAPVVYKSAVAENVGSDEVPIVFEVPQEFIIDIPTLTGQHGYSGQGYSFNVYAQDAKGTYLISNSFINPSTTRISESVAANEFAIWGGSWGCMVELSGVYE